MYKMGSHVGERLRSEALSRGIVGSPLPPNAHKVLRADAAELAVPFEVVAFAHRTLPTRDPSRQPEHG